MVWTLIIFPSWERANGLTCGRWHRKPLTSRLAPTLTLATGITAGMFLFTYLPQAAVMAFTSGPIAAISAFFLVLSESSTITTVLSKTFLIQDALVDTFDGTLVSKGQETTALVSQGRQIKASAADPINKLGRMVKKPFERYTPKGLIRYLMYLPLNFIPVVGTIIFVVAQGRRAGPVAHERYFQLKGWKSEQRRKHIESFKGAYTGYETHLAKSCIIWTDPGLDLEWQLYSWNSYP